MKKILPLFLFLIAFVNRGFSQKEILQELEQNFSHYAGISDKVWQLAEPGYLESQTSEMLINELKNAGFEIKKGVGNIPTAFVASYGSGSPVIGILAEMDALPGFHKKQFRLEKH